MIALVAWFLSDVTGASGPMRLTTPITFRADGKVAFARTVVAPARAMKEIDRILGELANGKRVEPVQIFVEEGSEPVNLSYDSSMLRLTLNGRGARLHGNTFGLTSGRIHISRRR